MKEEVGFLTLKNKTLFVHTHVPENTARKAVLFLNPLFDEKKRVQKFQIETARALCKVGFYILRFDYYCTGDSYGLTQDFDFEETIEHINVLIEYTKKKSLADEVLIIGIRLGADLALSNSVCKESITQLCLIEPIVKGHRYLLEQRIKRSAFYKLNGIIHNDQLIIQDQLYEDFQGYLLSQKAINFLEHLNSDDLNFTDKRVAIFRTSSLFNKKHIQKLESSLINGRNKIYHFQDNVPDFWMSLESINTELISKSIIKFLHQEL